jgi:hypothetical protein
MATKIFESAPCDSTKRFARTLTNVPEMIRWRPRDPPLFCCSKPQASYPRFGDAESSLTRRPAFKRRCPSTKKQQYAFVSHVQEILSHVPHDCIINIDETNWRSVTRRSGPGRRPEAKPCAALSTTMRKRGLL